MWHQILFEAHSSDRESSSCESANQSPPDPAQVEHDRIQTRIGLSPYSSHETDGRGSVCRIVLKKFRMVRFHRRATARSNGPVERTHFRYPPSAFASAPAIGK